MKPGLIIAAIVAVIVIVAGFYFVDIDQTQEGELPTVSVEGGQAPEFEAETGDIDVGEEDVTVTVPTIDVETPEEDANDAD